MTRTIVTAIVSTAAHGAERGALDAAIELDLGYGGVRANPETSPTEDLRHDREAPEIYASRMRTVDTRTMAMRLNTQDSDGTLIVTFADGLDEGRAKFAANQCKQQRKPARHLILPARGRTRIPEAVRAALLAWIDERHISVLHVVGPSEDQEPGIQQATHDALVWVLEDQAAQAPCHHRAGSCCECNARLCIDCGEPIDLLEDPEIATAVRWCRAHAHLDPGRPQTVVDTIARIAAELPNRPERPPLTTEDALRQVATTGDDDVRPLAIAELARRMAEVSGRPTHIAINLANVDAARAAGLDVQYLPSDHPGVLRPLGRVSIGMSEADARELERVHAAWRGDLPEPDAVPEPTDSDAPTEVHQTVVIPGYNAPAIQFAPCPCGGGEPGRPRHLPVCTYWRWGRA